MPKKVGFLDALRSLKSGFNKPEDRSKRKKKLAPGEKDVRVFDPRVRDDIKRTRTPGGQMRFLIGQKQFDEGEKSRKTGGPLPKRFFDKAKKRKTSVPV